MFLTQIHPTESHGGSKDEQMDYHRAFMRTQDMASDFAKKFNEAFEQVQSHFDESCGLSVIKKVARMKFIEPMLVELMDNGVEKNILIEKYLEGEYKKFNNNMGHVEDEVKQLVGRMNNLGLGGNFGRGDDGLGAIEEESEDESEEEDSDEEEDKEIFDSKESAPRQAYSFNDLQDAYFPQAFSHFTYEKSKKRLMVVDLQGVFKINNDGTKVYELTDPVLHKRKTKKNHIMKKWNFGRTDRNEKGMQAFFETHKCTDACKLLGLTEVDAETVCKRASEDMGGNSKFWRNQARRGSLDQY